MSRAAGAGCGRANNGLDLNRGKPPVHTTLYRAAEMPPEGEDGGAKMMTAEGALEHPTPRAIFGLHVTSRLPTFNEQMRDDIHERVTTLSEAISRGSRAGCSFCSSASRQLVWPRKKPRPTIHRVLWRTIRVCGWACERWRMGQLNIWKRPLAQIEEWCLAPSPWQGKGAMQTVALHAAPVLPTHFKQRIRDLAQAAHLHGIHQHIEHIGVGDHGLLQALQHGG